MIAALIMVREEREFLTVLSREVNWSYPVMEIRAVWHSHELNQFPCDLLYVFYCITDRVDELVNMHYSLFMQSSTLIVTYLLNTTC